MRNWKVLAFIGMVCIASVAAVATADWVTFADLSQDNAYGFLALLTIGLISEALAIRINYGKSAGNTSITFIPLLASVQLFGPAAAIVLMGTTGAFGEFAVRRKEFIRGLFNVAQWTLAAAVAGWAFTTLGGTPLEAGPESLPVGTLGTQLWPFVAFGLVFLALNHAAVSFVIALSQSLPFREVWAQMLGRSGASLQDLLISPIAIAVAFLYVQLGLLGILVVLFPLLFIRHAYVQNSQLREANRDLLRALVKAIETRDPYTSGHSLRVSHLAKKIAEELGLPRATVERVETAALLHDIGKIDAIYTEILMKPDALSTDERAIIESHVAKGVELLTSLRSVSSEVIAIVKHHHERIDGKGYPDGLRGDAIPLGSRIIVVCDAVDAMLSDRPYRRALALPVVLQQLRENTGDQFDSSVVACLGRTDLLQEYASVMRASGRADVLDPASVLEGGAYRPRRARARDALRT